MESFLEYGWWLSKNDKHVVLCISDFSWKPNGIWCGMSHTVGTVTKIVEVRAISEDGLCEVMMRASKPNPPVSYVLKRCNIMRSVDLSPLKCTGLPKYLKWWASINVAQQKLRESLCINASLLDEAELETVRIYMTQYERYMNGVGNLPENLPQFIKYGHSLSLISKFDERDVEEFQNSAPIVTPSTQKKRSSRSSKTKHANNSQTTDLALTLYDFVEPTEPSTHIRSRNIRLVSAGQSLNTVVRDDLISLPTADEVETGFVFGKDHRFMVEIGKVRPPTDPFTNQRILNPQNAENVYQRIKSHHLLETHLLTLRPMEYVAPGSVNGDNVMPHVFKSSKDFLKCIDQMPGDTFAEKRDAILPLITWEPVDGQHILHACQELASVDRMCGILSEENYNKMFVRRLAQVVIYDEDFKYLFVSSKRNEETTTRKYHSTVGETLEKIRSVWKKFLCPSPFKDEDIERRRQFLQCLPSVTGVKPDAKDNHNMSMKKMNVAYREWLSHATVSEPQWYALKAMCDAYDQGFTFYSEKDKKEELNEGGKKSITHERKRMSIVWLKPLKGTSPRDFVFLCEAATVDARGKDQKVYFINSSSFSSTNSLQAWAEKTKVRLGVHNAMKWLDAEAAGGFIDKKNWLSRNVEKFGDNRTLDFLGRDATNEFRKSWVTVKTLTGFETMLKNKTFIPSKVLNHFKLIMEGEPGLFADGKEIFQDNEGMWNLEFEYVGQKGLGLETKVKVGGCLSQAVEGKFMRPALWMFDCRNGPSGGFWSEDDYKGILYKIEAWMCDTERWNAIFMLPAGEIAEVVIRLLNIPSEPCWTVIKGSYVFAPQSGAKGQEVKGGGKIVATYTPVGPIIIVMRYPRTADATENFAEGIKIFDSVFIEPTTGWDLCTKYHEARCPEIVDEIIRSYFRPENWMIVAIGFTHMTHGLCGQTKELVLFERDENMVIWLRRWKDRAVDGLVGEDGEEPLWENPSTESREEFRESDDDHDHSEFTGDSQDFEHTDDGSSSPRKRLRLEGPSSKGKEKNGMHLNEERHDEDNMPTDFSTRDSFHVPTTQHISELNEDGYYYDANLDRWFDGMAFFIREEITSDIIGEKPKYNYILSDIRELQQAVPQKTTNGNNLTSIEVNEVNRSVAIATNFAENALVHPSIHDPYSLGLGLSELEE